MPLSAQSISRADLRSLAVQALKAANTDAGVKVYDPRSIPEAIDDLPALFVAAPSERKEPAAAGRGRHNPQFHTIVSLAVMGRVSSASAADSELALERLVQQVELALLSGPTLMPAVEQVTFLETHLAIDDESETFVGESTQVFGLQVWQLYEPDDGPLLTEIDLSAPIAPAPTVTPGFITALPQP